MESRNWLSNEQHLYITSQNPLYREKWTKTQKNDFKSLDWSSTRKSQLKSWIEIKMLKSWETIYLILQSDTLTQQKKDSLFDVARVRIMLQDLVSPDDTNHLSSQTNKQSIAREMITHGLNYFQSRYGKEEYIKDELDRLQKLLSHLDYQWRIKEEEDKSLKFYRLRKQMKNPPLITNRDKDTALCIHCYVNATGETMSSAIKNIRHDKNCTYHKSNTDLRDEQFIKKYPKKK